MFCRSHVLLEQKAWKDGWPEKLGKCGMLQLIIFEAETFLERQIIIMYCIFTKYNSKSDIYIYNTILNAINKYLLFEISISYQEVFAVWYFYILYHIGLDCGIIFENIISNKHAMISYIYIYYMILLDIIWHYMVLDYTNSK